MVALVGVIAACSNRETGTPPANPSPAITLSAPRGQTPSVSAPVPLGPLRSSSPAPTVAPTRATVTPTPTLSPSRVVLGPDGYGALKLGMTPAQAQATHLVGSASAAPGQTCPTGRLLAAPSGGPPSLFFSPLLGLVAIYAYPGITTPAGITVGSTVAQLQQAYPTWRGLQGIEGVGYVLAPGSATSEYRIAVSSGHVIEVAIQIAKPEERENPGELIHLDIKKLGRIGSVGHRITGRYPGAVNRHLGIGWEFVHVCIDDTSRVAFVQVRANQRKESAVAFLVAAVAYFAKLGIRVERVMTDNGSCYRSKTFRAACKRLGLRQIFTRPYTPKTNGKAERFIQTALREWAYARAYQNSDQRSAELLNWLHRYNWHRPHGSLQANTPISRLGLSEDILLRLHT